jgi:hypothetical protein
LRHGIGKKTATAIVDGTSIGGNPKNGLSLSPLSFQPDMILDDLELEGLVKNKAKSGNN